MRNQKIILNGCILGLFILLLTGCVPGNTLNQNIENNGQIPQQRTKLPSIPYEERVLIAVKDFDCVVPNFEYIGEQLTAAITTELINSKAFRVVERQKIDQIMEEKALSMTGSVEEGETVSGEGLKGLSDGFILTGTVTEFGKKVGGGSIGGFGRKKLTARVVIDGRLLNPETGEIITAMRGIGTKSKVSYYIKDTETGEESIEIGDSHFDSSQLGEATRKAIKHFIYNLQKQVYGY